MEEVIKEIFDETYIIDNLQKDGFVLVNKISQNPSAIYVGWTNSFQSMKFDAVVGLMRFDAVENLLAPILKNQRIIYESYGGWASTINCFERIDGQEIEKDNSVKLKEQLALIKEKVHDIESGIFTQLTTIDNVSSYLNTLDEDQLSEKVANPVLIRKFVIDSLAGNVTNPKLYCDKIVNEYVEAEKMYPHIFKNHDKAAKEVFSILNIT